MRIEALSHDDPLPGKAGGVTTLERWLAGAVADADDRQLPELRPLLEGLAAALARLRDADWGPEADGALVGDPEPAVSEQADAGLIDPTAEAVAAPPSHEPATSIRALAAAMRAGALAAEALAEQCLAAIDERDAQINAFVHVMRERARRQARDVDARRARGETLHLLAGIPVSLKDLIDVDGEPTTASSRVRLGMVASSDAAITARLVRAGAVLIGKTNLHEFAFGTTSEDSAFGPVRHPLDPTRSPGGSSGGSAAGVLAGMSLASIGTDTGGSIRIPAAACGLVGLKPTYGGVPLDGVVPLARSLDHAGPIARTVDDAAIVFDVLRGYPAIRPVPAGAGADVRKLRFGLPRAYFLDVLEDGVRHAFEQAVAALRARGARVDDVELPHASLTAPVYLATVLPEAAHYHAATLGRRPQDYTPPVRIRLEMSRYVLGEDYLRAQRGRDVLRREVDRALAGRHALLLPTLPIVAPRIGEPMVRIGATSESVRNVTLRLTQLFDLTGHPAISLPCGASDGLPVGAQLVGRLRQTRALLEVAGACERVWRTA